MNPRKSKVLGPFLPYVLVIYLLELIFLILECVLGCYDWAEHNHKFFFYQDFDFQNKALAVGILLNDFSAGQWQWSSIELEVGLLEGCRPV